MATFKELTAADIKTSRSFLNQLVDVISEDISGSTTRRKYQVFVTGGVGPGITSSLFQTVYDQDFSLQTANPVFDLTVGLYHTGSTVNSASSGEDSFGKKLFPSQTVMMREKVNVYKQYAQLLLGNATSQFVSPFGSSDSTNGMDTAMFMSFKRLFSRDAIKRETFAMKFFQSASAANDGVQTPFNLAVTSESGSAIFTDLGSSTNKLVTVGGNVGNIVDASNTARNVGLLFYDRGIAVLDLAKVTSGSQRMSGSIDAMNDNTTYIAAGKTIIGHTAEQTNAKFIPSFVASASIDNICDHICSTRFGSGSNTSLTFQNITNINSTLIFCRASADEFNYSSNPTFVDSDSDIVVIDEGQEETQRTFSFVTTVGLFDSNDNLLAVAKLSRPVEKNDEKDVTFRVRLDF
tara:strand:- start:16606 stop:17823 length:1218 start_codon:yes stop_codon:yes gene_type:complete